MRIRLVGTPAEVDTALAALPVAMVVTSVSRPYAMRRDPDRVRVYVDVDPAIVPTRQPSGDRAQLLFSQAVTLLGLVGVHTSVPADQRTAIRAARSAIAEAAGLLTGWPSPAAVAELACGVDDPAPLAEADQAPFGRHEDQVALVAAIDGELMIDPTERGGISLCITSSARHLARQIVLTPANVDELIDVLTAAKRLAVTS
ncbi:MAG: hypothetical protein JXA67_16520 [Micromonosporaceae bacterium]|nr:hypothetical protein [Micromonosporaceae bacterium]